MTTATNKSTSDIYAELMKLTQSDNKFVYVDYRTPMNEAVRVFTYRYASYTDWLYPSALECRGIMFSLNDDGSMKECISRPMQKFFNLNEFSSNMDILCGNLIDKGLLSKAVYDKVKGSTDDSVDSTMQYDSLLLESGFSAFETLFEPMLPLSYSDGVFAMDKADGSLISSYMSDGYLFLKSKGSIYSDQAVTAMQIINKPDYAQLRSKVVELEQAGYTVNMEYVSPQNRIVLYYDHPDLIILNVRNRETGEYMDYNILYADAVIRQYLVRGVDIAEPEEWVDAVNEEEDIEGFVCVTKDGIWFKVKTPWYVTLHHTKDSVTNNKTLYETIVNGAADDLKGLFVGNEYSVNKIQAFEDKFLSVLSDAIQTYLKTYEQVNGNVRKDYAINARAILNETDYPWLFGAIMNNFNKPLDYDGITDVVSDLFLKNCLDFVPEGYETPIAGLPDEDEDEDAPEEA